MTGIADIETLQKVSERLIKNLRKELDDIREHRGYCRSDGRKRTKGIYIPGTMPAGLEVDITIFSGIICSRYPKLDPTPLQDMLVAIQEYHRNGLQNLTPQATLEDTFSRAKVVIHSVVLGGIDGYHGPTEATRKTRRRNPGEGMSWHTADALIRKYLEKHAKDHKVTVSELVENIGCSRGTVSKCPSWQTYMKSKKAAGKAQPDCIARYTSPAGQVIELVIDAKAGRWNAAVDDIRAMRDYLALSTPYSHALFVANALAKGIEEKLREHVMNGKTARAISGRDLALLICQRMTDPNFNVELGLRQIFL